MTLGGLLVAVVGVLAGVASGCGTSDSSEADLAPLSPAAEAGRALAKENGCTACHGASGQGGVGPAWVGLAGSTRTLDDGSEIVADRAYLIRSIVDPDAERAAGTTIMMPMNDLSANEVASIVDYLEALG